MQWCLISSSQLLLSAVCRLLVQLKKCMPFCTQGWMLSGQLLWGRGGAAAWQCLVCASPHGGTQSTQQRKKSRCPLWHRERDEPRHGARDRQWEPHAESRPKRRISDTEEGPQLRQRRGQDPKRPRRHLSPSPRRRDSSPVSLSSMLGLGMPVRHLSMVQARLHGIP